MTQIVIWIAVGLLSIANLVLLVRVRSKLMKEDTAEHTWQAELSALREEVSRSEREIKDAVRASQDTTTNTLLTNIGEFSDRMTNQVERMRTTVDDRFQTLQQNIEARLEQIRETVTNQLQSTTDTLIGTVGELGEAQTHQLTSGTKAINDLTQSNETRIEAVRTTVDARLQAMQVSNEDKLEQMRKTVDEQLQSTLEKRLGESFNLVSQRLEEVQRGLGEMQNLATDVGDLKRVLTNVKARGTWGEVQLGALLEEVLTRDQYDTNVPITENSHVEYAIRLPGSDDGPDSCVWLPIDSKFPLADYDRLVDATDTGDREAVQRATKAFIGSVQNEAKKISEKYIVPPETTDFAIMFLPTEGLYAEVLRVPGQVTGLLQDYRIVVAGPTTLAAILSSLRMGFRTLAIEKRSSEVWKVLAAVKTEFGKFGDVMDKLKSQMDTAYNTINQTGTRTRALERKLKEVEELPPEEATARLELSDGEHVINEDRVDN